jgi:hypothetical protein
VLADQVENPSRSDRRRTIRQGQRDLAAGAMRNSRCLDESLLRALRIPQITFGYDARGRDLRLVDIGRHQFLRGTKIGVHGVLPSGVTRI